MSNTSIPNTNSEGKRSSTNSVVASLRSIFSRDTTPTNSRSSPGRSDKLLSECLQKLGKDVPLEKRLAFVAEFCELMSQYRIDRMFLEHIWCRVKDFFDPQHPPEAKTAGLRIIRTLAQHHTERIGIIKAECWQVFLTDPHIDVDTVRTFAMLTGNGRNIPPYEYEVGRVIETWLGKLIGRQTPTIKEELLTLLSNIIKFNFSVIPESQRAECIVSLCEISNTTTDVGVIKLCLDCFDEIVKYSHLPDSCVIPFISALCRTVNIERYSVFTWQIMKNVLQTYGESCIHPLCIILDDPQKPTNLLRGATFFLGMSMWGSQRITSLEIPPLQILPSMSRVLDSEEPIIGHEVCLAIRRLIKKYGDTLYLEWDLLIGIFDKLRSYLAQVPRSQRFIQMLSETVESTVALIQQNQYLGDIDDVFRMLMKYISLLSEKSNLLLLEYEFKSIHPAYPKWLLNLKRFAHYFYQISKHVSIRLLALDNLKQIYDAYDTLYGEPIIRTLFSIFHETLEKETCNDVREKALHLLGHMLQRSSCPAVIIIIDLLTKQAKIEKKPTAVSVLVESLHSKWTQSQSGQTIKIYHALIELLNHPLEPTRRAVLECVTQIRSNKTYQILLNGIRSSFLQLDVSSKVPVLTRKRQGIGSLSIHLLVNVLVNRLLKESSHDLFKLCIKGLESILCNNFMIAGCDLSLFANALQSELRAGRFASLVRNISFEERLELIVDAYHLVGIILIGYRRYIPRDQPFNLVELVVAACTESNHNSVRIKCLQILGACCVDFPSGVSYKSSSLVGILDRCNEQSEKVSGFLSCFLNSPKALSRMLSEQDLTTLFSVTSSLTSMTPENGLQANNIFRLLVSLLRSCDIRQRQTFYQTVSFSLLKESQCLLTEANIDLLSRYTFTDSVLDHSPTDQENNSILFSDDNQITHYLLGNAVLSIQIGNMNWVKTSIRRPSGRITWISQIQNRPRVSSTRNQVTHDVFTSLVDTIDCLPPEAKQEIPRSVSSSFSSECPLVEFESDFPDSAPFPRVLSPPYTDDFLLTNNEISFFADSSPPISQNNLTRGQESRDIEHESWSFDQAFGVNSLSSTHSFSESTSSFPSLTFTDAFSPEESQLVFSEPDNDTLFHIETNETQETTVNDQQKSAETQIPLSHFYPGLPSYEDGYTSSPSLHDESDFLLGPSPDFVKENKLSEDAQMLLHATRTHNSPISKSPISNIAFSVPVLGHGISAASLVQGSPGNEKNFLTPPPPPPASDNSPLAKSIIEQLENTVSFSETSSGQVTIKKSRSKTVPILRHDSTTLSLTPPTDERVSPPLETEAIHPSFMFLQLQQVPYLSEKALALEESEEVNRALKLLDLTKSKDTYKFGICYVKEGQTTEEEILSNSCGSLRYEKFLKSMGEMMRLKDCKVYSGGLDRKNDADGKWSLCYEDEVLQIMYHVVTMMASQESDGLRSNDLKKRHIGNNLVNIIYSESEKDFDINTFSGQFNLVNIIVKPLETGMFLLDIVTKEIQADAFAPIFFPIVTMRNSVPVLLRETIIAAEIACRNLKKKSQVPNRQERLKLIRKLKKHNSSCSHSSFPPARHSFNNL